MRFMLRLSQMATAVCVAGLFVPLFASGADPAALRGSTGMSSKDESAKSLVILGASYAGGWPSDRPIAGYRVVNKGVGGQQSFEMLARFESDVIALNPDAVVIWGFINDIFRSDQVKIDQTLSRTRESMRAMVELAKKSGITPILATEVTIRGKEGWREWVEALIGSLLGKSSYQEYVNGHVRETNRWIRDLGAREGILLLDLERVLADQQNVRKREYALPDGSHISAQGYDALIRYSEERLKASLSSG